MTSYLLRTFQKIASIQMKASMEQSFDSTRSFSTSRAAVLLVFFMLSPAFAIFTCLINHSKKELLCIKLFQQLSEFSETCFCLQFIISSLKLCICLLQAFFNSFFFFILILLCFLLVFAISSTTLVLTCLLICPNVCTKHKSCESFIFSVVFSNFLIVS